MIRIRNSNSQRNFNRIRHCERSEAIHSFFAPQDGLLRCARNDAETWLRDLAACFARALPEIALPSENRGRREHRVHAAPAVSCATCTIRTRTRAYRVSGGNPAFPAQWFYGLFRALPGEPGSFATVARGALPANLTPASGCQDHTTSPSASAPFVFRRIRVHRIPSRGRDDSRLAPLSGRDGY